ncbi:MAG: sulfate reduction electron transfer complex DsrMKJOP subunit DsrJ [Planctomycetes bacterium]|nr:sulfate reduction electron transfer complex DsrMKJOP subunit DsrJ [Planctomycetota bacterium]
MNDKPKIIVGLVVVLVAATFPFWYTLAKGRDVLPEDRERPSEGSRCVMDDPVANHMQVLNTWRDEVVREGDTEQIKVDGKKYHKSLTDGCLQCHSSREDHCDRCHEYANVELTCWECHLGSKGD